MQYVLALAYLAAFVTYPCRRTPIRRCPSVFVFLIKALGFGFAHHFWYSAAHHVGSGGAQNG